MVGLQNFECFDEYEVGAARIRDDNQGASLLSLRNTVELFPTPLGP